MHINELVQKAHTNAKNKGFYDKQVQFPTLIALAHSELSEALEADREGDFFKAKTELADTVIRIADMCGYLDIDLEKEITEKMKINSYRQKKHGKRY